MVASLWLLMSGCASSALLDSGGKSKAHHGPGSGSCQNKPTGPKLLLHLGTQPCVNIFHSVISKLALNIKPLVPEIVLENKKLLVLKNGTRQLGISGLIASIRTWLGRLKRPLLRKGRYFYRLKCHSHGRYRPDQPSYGHFWSDHPAVSQLHITFYRLQILKIDHLI